MTESKGPRTEPWGTPQEEVWKEKRLLYHVILCDLSECDDAFSTDMSV